MMARTLAVAILAFCWLGVATGPAAALSKRLDAAQIRAEALAHTAVAQAEAGDKPGAMESLALALVNAEAISDGDDRNEVLASIAWAQARTGDVAGALETTRSVDDPEYRFPALTQVALVLAEMGDRESAGQAASLGLDLFEGFEDPAKLEFFGMTMGSEPAAIGVVPSS